MTPLLTRMFKDRTSSMVQNEREWRADRGQPKPAEPSAAKFWWAYALLLISLVALAREAWRAWA